MRSMTLSFSASLLGDRDRLANRLLRPLGIAPALERDGAHERRRVVLDLAHALLVDAAADGDRMSGADVRGRGHGRHVRGQRDEDAGRGRAGSRGPDPHDHGDLGVQQPLADRAHRALEPARSVELDHQRLRLSACARASGRLHEAQRDGTDHALEIDEGDGRRGMRGGSAYQEGGEQDQQGEADRVTGGVTAHHERSTRP